MGMRNHAGLCAVLFILAVWAAGCSTSSTKPSQDDPYTSPDISGVWLGWIDTQKEPSVFSIGMIVEQDDAYASLFVADDRQYLSPVADFGVSPFTVEGDTAIFSGDLAEFSWTGVGDDYATLSRALYLYGPALERSSLGFGWPGNALFFYDDAGGFTDDLGRFIFFYNTTYEVSPNVENLGGQWVIENSWQDGNTLILTITPTDASNGVMTATDELGNRFSGSITVRSSPEPCNVYDVSLQMNSAVNLDGLATYVLEMNTNGIEVIDKTLVIGAASSDHSHAVGGLATPR